MDQRGLNMRELSAAAKLGETAVRDLLERRPDPRLSTVLAVSKALGKSLSEIVEGNEPLYQIVAISGCASAGEAWEPFDDGLGELELHIAGEPIAIEVKGSSMAPIYRNGDILAGPKCLSGHAEKMIGRDCILATESGERYVKYLTKGSTKGRFDLRSYNPLNKDIENVKLAWAAPIVWVKRSLR